MPESLHTKITEEGHIYFLAYNNEEPVGYLSIQPEGEGVFHLQKLYTLPSWQRRGLGRLLFEHAVKVIKELHPAP